MTLPFWCVFLYTFLETFLESFLVGVSEVRHTTTRKKEIVVSS
jgi:hypothetical protein